MIKKHLFLAILMIPLLLRAQPLRYNFFNYSTDNGLPTNTLQYVYADSYGFLWLASFDGLYRWDGYAYKKYQREEKNANSLDNNIVYSIYEDTHGRLWVGTIDGLCLYDRQQDVFLRCRLKPGDDKVPVNSILEDKGHRLWLGTSDGLCSYDAGTGQPHWFTDGGDPDVVFCMAVDSSNDIWLGTFNKGLKKYAPVTRQWRAFRQDPQDRAAFPSDRIRSLLTDSHGRLWIGTDEKGVVVADADGRITERYAHFPAGMSRSSGPVTTIYEDRAHTIWIGVRREPVYYLRPGDHTLTALQTPSSISSIYEDQFGNTWFATAGNGLCGTNLQKNRFGNYLFAQTKGGEATARNVTCFFEDGKGIIWVGTNGNGMFRFDPATRSSEPVLSLMPGLVVYDIHSDARGQLYIGTYGQGLLKYDPVTGAVKKYLHDPADPHSSIYNDIKSVLPDDSLVWVGTHGEGLQAMDPVTGRFTHYRNNTRLPMDLHGPAWINHLFKDHRGRLWISTYKGIYLYDGKVLRHFEHTDSAGSISGNSINMVAEDSAGRIWIAGESGLDRYEEGGGFFRCSEHYHLPRSDKAVIADQGGRLWISSIDGILAFDPVTGTVRTFDLNDGLPDNSFFQKAAFRSHDGTLYFGSPRGFTVFRSDVLKDISLPAYFYFTDLYINNKLTAPGDRDSPLKKALSFTDTIELRPAQSIFSVEFKSVDLYSSARTRYSYKLEGLDDAWIDLKTDRKVFFMHLQPGTYILHVRYTDVNGRWQIAPRSLTICMLPAWWQTWWFRIAVALVAIAGIAGVFYLRVNAIKRRNALLREQVHRRTYELSEANASLIEQNDQIKVQKESLEVSNDEVRRQSDKILIQQQQILLQNQELGQSVEKLKELNRTKDYFFSILAHDLKNPVFALTEIIDFLKHNFQRIDRVEMEKYVDSLRTSSVSVYDLLTNLLNWSRTQVNRITPKPIAFLPSAMIDRNRRLLEPQLAKKNIRLSIEVSAEHRVYADYEMIDTAIRNILSNAIKFTPYNGSIDVISVIKEEMVVISIRDSGAGISPEQMEQLFLVGPRKVTYGTAGEKGTGLGLLISREFVEDNGGRIRAESAPGKGSVFHLWLPATDAKTIGSAPVLPDPLYEMPGLSLWETMPMELLVKLKGKKILIVDDDRELRNYLKHIISDTFEIFEAANGKEGLKIATEVVPAIIITDVLMPDMDGLQFCRTSKSRTESSHIPIVILTSQWDESMQVSAYEAGADIYLTKPVKKDLLIQVILNILQNQERLREKIFDHLVNDLPVQPAAPVMNKLDGLFLSKLVDIISNNLSDANLDAKLICREMATSRTVLYAKLKTLTGQTVHEFIKSIRLRKSVQLLMEGRLSVSQVAFEVGFNSHSYFDRCFIKQYGMGPKEYIGKKREGLI